MTAKEVLKLISEIDDAELMEGLSEADQEVISDNVAHIKEIVEDTEAHLEGALWYRIAENRSN